MTPQATVPSALRGRRNAWLLVAALLLLILGANIHLVYVAFGSQPECVEHFQRGAGETGRGMFGAAQSACRPMVIQKTR